MLDYLSNCGLPHVRQIVTSLTRLEDSGLLYRIDAEQILSENRQEIAEKVEQTLEDWRPWREIVADQWRILSASRNSFVDRNVPDDRRFINANHYTLLNALIVRDEKITSASLRNAYRVLLEKDISTFDDDDAELVKMVARPLLFHIVGNDCIQYCAGVTVLDWDDSEEYYRRVFSLRWGPDGEELNLQAAARRFFELAAPGLRPNNIDAVIRFVHSDGAVARLRSDLASMIALGEIPDSSAVAAYFAEALRAELTTRRTERKFRFFADLVSIFSPPAAQITMSAVEGAIGTRDQKKRGSWMYAMQGAVSKSAH